ncbi:MAG TPA: GNAT family N-acetyltransferase [Acholeplasmataceae bacterium]|jgi:GNAT superfamily N-acetyltransferase|nr:GNAT family N-acetyltransferase [Acholeplasmataceae bacterium]
MTYHIKPYPNDKAYHQVFMDVVHFISKKNEEHQFLNMHWSRFEWMFARDTLNNYDLPEITLFLDEHDKICGLMTFEDEPRMWYMVYEDDKILKKLMIDHFIERHDGDDLIIPNDPDMIEILDKYTYEITDDKDPMIKFTFSHVACPQVDGYQIKSLEEDYRLDQIHHALWKGFNHGDDINYSDENLESRRHTTSSPHFKKRYTYVATHDNQYVAYAGIWYLDGTKTALIEPVATVPEHRKKGLAKACIYHAICEAQKDGAKDIFVGSTQKFYYDIGFKDYYNAYYFRKKQTK